MFFLHAQVRLSAVNSNCFQDTEVRPVPRAKRLKKGPAFSATAFKHGVESRKCRVIAVSLCDIGIGAGAELGADTVHMDALLRVRDDTGSFSKAIDCTLEAPSFSGLPGFLLSLTPPVIAVTRSRGM